MLTRCCLTLVPVWSPMFSVWFNHRQVGREKSQKLNAKLSNKNFIKTYMMHSVPWHSERWLTCKNMALSSTTNKLSMTDGFWEFLFSSCVVFKQFCLLLLMFLLFVKSLAYTVIILERICLWNVILLPEDMFAEFLLFHAFFVQNSLSYSLISWLTFGPSSSKSSPKGCLKHSIILPYH